MALSSLSILCLVAVVTLPSLTDAQVSDKHVGCYYGVWAYTRPGVGSFWPEDIDVSLCDVIYYGFGNILNDTFEVCSWDPWFDMSMEMDSGEQSIKNCIQERDGFAWPPGCVTDDGLEYCHYDGIRRTVALKANNPNLKVLFSVGGWTAGGWVFSQMAQTPESRLKFIQSAVHFIDYFGLDGIDLDWEFPGYDMLTLEETDPNDKYHFTSLMQELRAVFDKHDPPYLLTFAAAADPKKAADGFELDLVHNAIDWINIMSYDYHGAWDPFTGIDQPLYGKWEEGFPGHPMYQFNMHDTVQYYLNQGVPSEKLVLGIHTEGKSWILEKPATEETCPGPDCGAGIYCPTAEGGPNVTYSRQVGWMFYYEVLQFYYNDTIPDAELSPEWPDLIVGKEHWTIYDHENNNVDGCYMAPFAYQGKYWISYDDVPSVNLKARYANHYGLKGAFVWEVDSDNFQGLFAEFGFEKYTILAEINRAVISKEGLTPEEVLGHANENKGKCVPEAPMCIPDWGQECTLDNDCNENPDVLCDPTYSNCFYCDGVQCKNGCGDNVNCGGDNNMCTGDHECEPNGTPIVNQITVKTQDCANCDPTQKEQGLQIELTSWMDLETCITENLDRSDHHDYVAGRTSRFGSRDGIGPCGIDLYQEISSAKALWTGPGTWTPNSVDTMCVDFFGDKSPTCCCSLSRSITNSDGWVDLSDCVCHYSP